MMYAFQNSFSPTHLLDGKIEDDQGNGEAGIRQWSNPYGK